MVKMTLQKPTDEDPESLSFSTHTLQQYTIPAFLTPPMKI